MIETAKEFILLRESKNPNLYRRAASESATAEVWLEIIENHPNMREWVAYNKTVSLKILDVLADDSDPKVRFVVASKRILSIELQEKLADDPDESVRLAIANNPKTQLSILQKLTHDAWKNISETAMSRLKVDKNDT